MKLNVANKSCIRRISFRHMKSAPARNLIAILAIALTSILFTAIFTIAFSVLYSFEQSIARQSGSSGHGVFKAITAEQLEAIKDDPLIKQYGIQHVLGFTAEESLSKLMVTVSYKDANEAAFTFCTPAEGRLPQEGTNEAAADTQVLSLLGVPLKLGEEFSVTFDVDGQRTTESFILCGYWENDEVTSLNDILVPESRVNEVLSKLNTQYLNGVDGLYFMDVMFKNSSHVEENLTAIVENHGYEASGMVGGPGTAEDNIIPIGVNWAYIGAQMESSVDLLTAVAMALILIVIIFTGYLIIYNIFQISVSNDIRFYGLLKTIGATGKQLKRIVLMQALLLSVIGIPMGLAAGYGIGALILPRVMETTAVTTSELSVNPLLFLISALFGLVTVIISCRKPGKIAARVSPIEAIRYSEGQTPRRKTRRSRKESSIFGMAFANLGRSRKRTAVTILSLSLAVLLLNITVTFTGGFDMEKYVSKMNAVDFHIADSSYYITYRAGFHESATLPESAIETIQAQGGIADAGRTYALTEKALAFESVTDEYFRERNAWGLSMMGDETERAAFLDSLRNENGEIVEDARLYGMEPFCLSRMTVLDGDISKLYEEGNYIAAAYMGDDYGNPEYDSNWAEVGDTVKIHYEEYEYYDPNTGEIIEDLYAAALQDQPWEDRIVKSHDEEYEVVATVVIPSSMTYRFYGDTEFILNSETFKKDCGSNAILYYVFDMEEGAIPAMEQFLTNYTNGAGSQFDFESRQKTIEDFASFQSMFLFAGGALSFIVGLIGVLNFLNTILTGILTRHREFAVLQSVGMTGRQLKEMLISEGVLYAVITIVFSFILIVATAPFVSSILNASFWFFTYRFTALPAVVLTPFFLLLGVLAPLVTYRFASGKSIVERLREAE